MMPDQQAMKHGEANPALALPRAAIDAGVLARFGAGVSAAYAENRPLILITLLYIFSGFIVEWVTGVRGIVQIGFYSDVLVTLTIGFVVLFLCFHAFRSMVRVQRGQSLFRTAWVDLRDRYLTWQRVLGFLLIFAVFPPFMSMLTSYKQALPFLHAYDMDVTLMRADRWLHGGRQPWEILHSWMGSPLVTSAFNAAYQAWFFVMFSVVFWQAWSARRLIRMQFLLSFMLTWVLLGTVLATIMASAGPCYYDRVTGLESPYAPLMTYLHDAAKEYPVWSLDVQRGLWNIYTATEEGGAAGVSGGGISAMPSLHVAITVLCALAGWTARRWLGALLSLFAVVIMLATVHLGWHYALDGYVAAVLAIVIWKVTGWGLRRFSGLEDDGNAYAASS
jgi:membrane-associated phospholipid phosphatase